MMGTSKKKMMEYESEDDMRTMMRAEEIKQDGPRMARMKRVARMRRDEMDRMMKMGKGK